MKIVKDSNGTSLVQPSQTRQDPTYIFWYTLSMIWHPTITTAIIPFLALSYMNMHIFKGIKETRKVSRYPFFKEYFDVVPFFFRTEKRCFN